jgi:hypothetical protein
MRNERLITRKISFLISHFSFLYKIGQEPEAGTPRWGNLGFNNQISEVLAWSKGIAVPLQALCC